MPPLSSRQRRRRRLPVAALVLVALVVIVVVVLSGGATPSTGFDVSYPQCAGDLPSAPLFGVVGVNAGRANTTNPCLGTELGWAQGAPGQRSPTQPRVSLYINTGNPGGHHVSDFPHTGTAPGYGACTGRLTDACSYLYGQQRARHSFVLVAAHAPALARRAPWWLDVELLSTWAGTYQLNVAALRGFVAGLQRSGARGPVGIYSTAAQWKDITGLSAQSTSRAFHAMLPDWVAGTVASLAQARTNCVAGGFTGAPPVLAQYRLGPRDADLRCPGTA
ncbi:MAG TPA: hypothetical protein VFN48_03215 [Solirubrobacteraceae bacterium]|nr:hypothetical protein [Solirubrobacteraceae bacterium]